VLVWVVAPHAAVLLVGGPRTIGRTRNRESEADPLMGRRTLPVAWTAFRGGIARHTRPGGSDR